METSGVQGSRYTMTCEISDVQQNTLRPRGFNPPNISPNPVERSVVARKVQRAASLNLRYLFRTRKHVALEGDRSRKLVLHFAGQSQKRSTD